MKSFIALMLAMPLTACGFGSQSLSKYELYEARQQCAESVPRVLKYDDGRPMRGNLEAILTHYNATLDVCFVALETSAVDSEKGGKAQWILVSAESYQWIPVEMKDNTWKGLMENEDLDLIVSKIK